jgi:putative transposase
LKYSLNQLFGVIGISKQAVSQQWRRRQLLDTRINELVVEAESLRQAHPGCGVEKMYYVLKPDFIGRDRFIEIMMDVGFRLKAQRNYRRTTYAGRIRYPNLIKGLTITAPCMLWQSDITYIPVGNQFYYAVFILDVYSKKIVGYQLSRTMHATANLKALTMALKNYQPALIHHSDRGSQYGCKQYLELLKAKQMKISMGLRAQDNAYAERINRTIKEEYLQPWKAQTYDQLKHQLNKAVTNYNNIRPHDHLKKLTPKDFEDKWYKDPTFKKPQIRIFDDNNL